MNESLRGPIIVVEITALGLILALVENTAARVTFGLLLALLLARAALVSRETPRGGPPSGLDERRHDHLFRHWVNVLLKRIREFHTICESIREEKANLTIAQMKLREIEGELQTLLSQVTDTAKPSDLRRQARRTGGTAAPSRRDEAYGETPRGDFDYD